MENVLGIIKDVKLDYRQKRHALAAAAENSLPYVSISEKSKKYMEDGIICNLNEGNAPYRARYILPDYLKYMKNGSEYLNVQPPKDMYDAVNALLIMYSYVPSITSYPVYLGGIDDILEPYRETVSPEEFEKLLKLLLINVDRTLPDAFVHMNIGPKDTITGRTVLKLEKELKKAIPNLSLKCSEETPDDFIKLAIETSLVVGKPYFINHKEIVSELGENYGIASCYNSLKIGGGSYTLVRLNLKKLAETAKDYDDFIKNKLKDAVDSMCEIINARIKFIVEEVNFFEESFLSKEGLIDKKNFTAMAAEFGLYECVEVLTKGLKLGHDDKADDMGEEIIKTMRQYIKAKDAVYCEGTGNKFGFHAQSGIDTDVDVTAGVRIKYGEEPDIFDQINTEARLQKYFDTGVSDIYLFDSSVKGKEDGLLKVIKGAFKKGMRIMTINSSDSELVRITGYLVKRSDIEKYSKGQQVREDTVGIGADSIEKNNIMARKVRGAVK